MGETFAFQETSPTFSGRVIDDAASRRGLNRSVSAPAPPPWMNAEPIGPTMARHREALLERSVRDESDELGDDVTEKPAQEPTRRDEPYRDESRYRNTEPVEPPEGFSLYPADSTDYGNDSDDGPGAFGQGVPLGEDGDKPFQLAVVQPTEVTEAQGDPANPASAVASSGTLAAPVEKQNQPQHHPDHPGHPGYNQGFNPGGFESAGPEQGYHEGYRDNRPPVGNPHFVEQSFVPQNFEGQQFDQQQFAPDPFHGDPRFTENSFVPEQHHYSPMQQPQFGHDRGMQRPQMAPPSSRDLSTSMLLRQVKPAPSSGWRKFVYAASGRYLNLGDGAKDMRRNALIRQVNQPLQGCYKIALLSLKGGVGKTTVTATVGSTFSSLRGDRVIAVDANPDRGTLSQKIPLETPATVRHLLRDELNIERYSDVRSYTSQGPSRLEVLASESDPAVSEAFSADDYGRTMGMLERFYSVVLTDCGTGLMHSAMTAVLSQADSLVIVSSGSVDGARSASATLDWLDAHGYGELVARSIAVINAVRPRSGKVDLERVVDHFARRCRAVRLIPFDPHLEEGAEVDLQRLKPKTREALLELAAAIAADFPAATARNADFS